MKLIRPPDKASYSVDFGQETVRQQLDGGAGRYRKDIAHSSSVVGCQWQLNQNDYDYFMAFYRLQTRQAALPFTIDLIIDGEELVERTVHFIPGTVRLVSQSGMQYVVGANLEVHAVVDPDQDTDDEAIIDAYNEEHDYDPEA
jgi:hypothetical protein